MSFSNIDDYLYTLHFILLAVTSSNGMSVENSLILLVICNISIVKNLFVGEFLRFRITVTLLIETLSTWYAVARCIKELMMTTNFSFGL